MKSIFLLSILLLMSVMVGFSQDTETPDSDLPETEALHLIEALGCRACHRIQGYGGSIASDLSTIGSRMTAAEIRAQVSTHAPTRTGDFMPAYDSLTPQELDLLSSHLYHLQ